MIPDATPARAAEPGRGRVKGAAFREFVAWIEEDRGPDSLAGIVAALAPQVQRHLQAGRPALGLLAATWYPAEVVHAFLDRLMDGISEPELERMARQGAAFAMQNNLRGVYRSLFGLFVSPAIYSLGVQQLWNLHYDSGKVKTGDAGHKAHRAVIQDWRGHHPFICRLNMAAVFPLYAAMKCRDIEVRRESCVSYGGPSCSWLITWGDR